MITTDLQGLDPDAAERLRQHARAEAARTSPWPGVHTAIRRDRRHRVVRGTGIALACAGIVALALPGLTRGYDGVSPAAPADGAGSPLTAEELATMDQGELSVTYGDLRMVVGFDVEVVSSNPMPAGGGECHLFDHPLFVERGPGARVPDLSMVAATGCRGGIVGQPLSAPVDAAVPFAGQPTSADVAPCSLTGSAPITSSGGLDATTSWFDCAGGALRQWVFDDQLIWSLDGGARMAGLVDTATRTEPDPVGGN